MGIFQYESYREAIQSLLQKKKAQHSSLTLSSLAQGCLIQPSYLTNVLKGRADLNSDQLYRLGEQLSLNQEETEFLLLLLEIQKTQHEKRRRELRERIQKTRSKQLRAEKNISAKSVTLSVEQTEKYYLDPYVQLVHIYLTIPTGKKTLHDLAGKFSVSSLRMQQVLNVLEEVNCIRKRGSRYEIISEGKHLARESVLLKPHQQLLRLKGLEQLQALPPEQIYSFSATISTSPEVRTKIQGEFLKFLKIIEKMVRESEAEKLYQVNFDLFPWEKDDL